MISHTITGKNVGDFEFLDAKVASRLKKIVNGDFKRSVFTDEETALKEIGFHYFSRSVTLTGLSFISTRC